MSNPVHDRGCHVANVCRTSGRVVETLVSEHLLSLQLMVLPGALESYRDYRVMMWCNNDMHAAMTCTQAIEVGKECTAPMHVRLSNARTLYMMLFACTRTDGALCQELVAFATCKQNGLVTTLVDIDNQPTATLYMSGFPFDNRAPHTSGNTSSTNNTRALRELIDKQAASARQLAQKGYYVASMDAFPLVRVFLDKPRELPIGWFAFLATRMQATPHAATAYFERLLAVSQRMQLPGSSVPQQLADMLALPSLAWVYKSDTDSRNKDGEYWASLWSNPPGPLNSFDCEDGAKALLELFHVFRLVDLNAKASPKLRQMQTLAKGYRGFLAIGELYQPSEQGSIRSIPMRTAEDYVMHCYVVLLPFQHHEVTAPVITLDATSYTSTAWHARSTLLTAPHDSYALVYKDPLQCERRSPADVLRRGTYGALVSLMTSQRDCQTEHYLMGRTPAFDFLFDPQLDTHRTRCCYSVSYAYAEARFAEALSHTPMSRFPTPTDDTSLPPSWDTVLMPAYKPNERGAVLYSLSQNDRLQMATDVQRT